MDGGRGHSPEPQNTRGLVGWCKDGKGAPVFAFFATFIVARNDINPGIFQRLVQFGQKQGLTGARLADHGHGPAIPARWMKQVVFKIDPCIMQERTDPIKGNGLIVGELNGCRVHGATLQLRGRLHQS